MNLLRSLRARSNRAEPNDRANVCTGRHIAAWKLKERLDSYDSNELLKDEPADLSGACLHREDLTSINDLRRISFHECNLREALLGGCKLQGTLLKHCDLRNADLCEAELSRANLEDADLRNAILEAADLTEAVLDRARLEGANLKDAKLGHTRIQRNSLGARIKQEQEENYHDARLVYLTLKENFQSIGAYDAAGWAYMREKISERKSFAPLRARKGFYGEVEGFGERALVGRAWFMLKYLGKWGYALALEFIWGYGQKPLRVLRFCLSIVLLFAAIYWVIGGIETTDGVALSIQELVVYSLAALTLNTPPNIALLSVAAQVVTSIEGILGVAALALFTTALAHRMGGR